MPFFSFTAFDVDEPYYLGQGGSVLGQLTLDISDTDNFRHNDNSADPDNDQLFSVDGAPFSSDYAVCFAGGTSITTPGGPKPVEFLRPGDMVRTLDRSAQPVVWTNKRDVSKDDVNPNPNLWPVRIRLNIQGREQRLFVSQQHAISLRNFANDARSLPDALLRAKHVAEHFGSAGRIAYGKAQISYYHFLLPRHKLVWADGILAESLHLGPQA